MIDVATQLEILSENLNLTDEQKAQLTVQIAKLQAKIIADTERSADGVLLTDAGKALLGKALAGAQLQYTKVQIGDGVFDGTDAELRAKTELINPKLDLPIVSLTHNGGGLVTLTYDLKNANIKEGFWDCEMGVFALDPDTGEEILYCYRNNGGAGTYIPAGGGGYVMELRISVIVVVDQAANVTAVLDSNLVYVSQNEFVDHINSTNPHPNIPKFDEEITTTPAFWTTGTDDQLHPLSYENAKKLILGDTAATIPMLNLRVNQLEANLGNVIAHLSASSELGIDANLLIVEDFKNPDTVDQYNCEVKGSAAKDDTIALESDENIIIGSCYWITDGIRQELIRADTVIRNGNYYVVLAEEPLQNTYIPDQTRLYRTTASLTNEGQTGGAGVVRGFAVNPSLIFRGVGGNVATSILLETTMKNADAFTVTDDGTFTAAGYFTLAS